MRRINTRKAGKESRKAGQASGWDAMKRIRLRRGVMVALRRPEMTCSSHSEYGKQELDSTHTLQAFGRVLVAWAREDEQSVLSKLVPRDPARHGWLDS
jgi:hypothetical protein